MLESEMTLLLLDAGLSMVNEMLLVVVIENFEVLERSRPRRPNFAL